ncbi:MAG: hypothetical protein AMQ74_00344 [Candidatus Methanofastidiosum methylothiophilum]|uniref:Uncharacterized protein n=1 Tax=Candidatus Methanofastidiosum methylothiophilum TaxID=1705564 RepID=A0A150J8S3_9EURY|nr:MAG: hypothetical protein AMQ74_00344 [Candidatus Methanofastidiosum methylthiophilus]
MLLNVESFVGIVLIFLLLCLPGILGLVYIFSGALGLKTGVLTFKPYDIYKLPEEMESRIRRKIIIGFLFIAVDFLMITLISSEYSYIPLLIFATIIVAYTLILNRWYVNKCGIAEKIFESFFMYLEDII